MSETGTAVTIRPTAETLAEEDPEATPPRDWFRDAAPEARSPFKAAPRVGMK